MKEREAIHVDVEVELGNGNVYSNAWTTPVPFGRALGKAARWMREQLRDEKIPGRSDIRKLRVSVRRTGKPYVFKRSGGK